MVTKTNNYEAPVVKQSEMAAQNQVLCQSGTGFELTATTKSLGDWQ